jgi:hypothetical protein
MAAHAAEEAAAHIKAAAASAAETAEIPNAEVDKIVSYSISYLALKFGYISPLVRFNFS